MRSQNIFWIIRVEHLYGEKLFSTPTVVLHWKGSLGFLIDVPSLIVFNSVYAQWVLRKMKNYYHFHNHNPKALFNFRDHRFVRLRGVGGGDGRQRCVETRRREKKLSAEKDWEVEERKAGEQEWPSEERKFELLGVVSYRTQISRAAEIRIRNEDEKRPNSSGLARGTALKCEKRK